MFRYSILFVLFLFFVIPGKQAYAQLSGSYTIGAGGDYTGFNDAVTDLTSLGVSGAVTFNVISGSYDEQIEITAISGVSAANTITFQAQSGSADDVTLYHMAAGSEDNYVIRLDGASYINFNNLTLQAEGTTYAKIMDIINSSSHLNITNSIFNGYESASSSSNQILLYGDNSVNSSIMIDNCEFNEGSSGVYYQGMNSSNLSGSNIIQNSVFNGMGYYGIYLQYQNSPKIIGNQITNASSNGIYLNTCQSELEVISNQVYNGSNNNVVNNSFMHSGWGLAAQIYTPSAVNTLDYNNYFSNGNYLAAWGTTDYYDFESFRTASSKDAHSVNVYAHYASSTDLHTMTPWLNGMGTPLSEVAEDIDGETRDGSTPDIGADEFTPDAANMTPLAGNYTIGGGSPDYDTFDDAVADLLIKGVSDTVFMNIRSGNYQVHKVLYTIPGTAMDMPVVFQSESGSREDVTLYYYASDNNDNYILYLHGADWLHFRDLAFSGNTGANTYSINFMLSGGVNGFNLINCSLSGTTNGSSNAALISAQSSLSMHRLIQGNLFTNGGYGIYQSGVNNNEENHGSMILDNEFNGQNNYIVYITYDNGIVINDNTASAMSSNGVYISNCDDDIKIMRNRIYTYNYGLYINSCTGGDDLENDPGLIANNFITATNNYGFYLNNNSNQNYYYNSVNMTSGNNNTTGFYLYNGSNNNVVNNSFMHSGWGLAAQIYTPSAVNTLDYNNYF
ncbi:MAG: hypothetical protein P8X42_06580, partial [Calditrichaceae bacterium]